jgi:hypothetical protein
MLTIAYANTFQFDFFHTSPPENDACWMPYIQHADSKRH